MYGEQLPEIAPTERLVDLWRDLGCARAGVSGPVSFDWQEISAFNELMHCGFMPFEAQCLADMSRAYVGSISDKNPLSKSPMERAND